MEQKNELISDEKQDELTNEEFKKTISGLSRAFERLSPAEEKETTDIISSYPYVNLNSVENVSRIIIDRIKHKVAIYAIQHSSYPNQISPYAKSRIIFLYQNYGFIKNQLVPLIDTNTGGTVDMVRNLVALYIDKLLDSDTVIPRFDKVYPNFGDINDWVDYIEKLYELYYNGPSDEYFNKYNKLIQAKNKYLKK